MKFARQVAVVLKLGWRLYCAKRVFTVEVVMGFAHLVTSEHEVCQIGLSVSHAVQAIIAAIQLLVNRLVLLAITRLMTQTRTVLSVLQGTSALIHLILLRHVSLELTQDMAQRAVPHVLLVMSAPIRQWALCLAF